MTHDKAVFIIPGFRQNPKSKAYKNVAKILTNEGYLAIPVNIAWKNSTISKATGNFLKVYKKHKLKKKYILGFSYGSMIALIASTKVRTSGVILCSLSPYFNEDILNKKSRSGSQLAKKRFEDFSNHHAETLAQKIKTEKIIMIYGTLESKSLIKRVKETFEQIDSDEKHLISVSKTEHKIGDLKYLSKIHEAARILL